MGGGILTHLEVYAEGWDVLSNVRTLLLLPVTQLTLCGPSQPTQYKIKLGNFMFLLKTEIKIFISMMMVHLSWFRVSLRAVLNWANEPIITDFSKTKWYLISSFILQKKWDKRFSWYSEESKSPGGREVRGVSEGSGEIVGATGDTWQTLSLTWHRRHLGPGKLSH